MDELFRVYPEIAERIDALCGYVPWGLTGASALIHDDSGRLYLEVVKPKHWRRRDDGVTVVGIGGIGGSLEGGETAIECLHREAREEIGVSIEIESSETTYLVYERSLKEALVLKRRGSPLPLLFTISQNLYRQDELPGAEVLAIATYSARLLGRPRLCDLFGLLSVPSEGLEALLGSTEVPLVQARRIPGLRLSTQSDLPEDTVLEPVWTARSLQILLRRGRAWSRQLLARLSAAS